MAQVNCLAQGGGLCASLHCFESTDVQTCVITTASSSVSLPSCSVLVSADPRPSAHAVCQPTECSALEYADGRYSDGVLQPSYGGDRSYEDLSRYIDNHATEYAEHLAEAQEKVEELSTAKANSEGKIQEVDEEGLEALKAKGPVLTEYFAPWCGQ